MKTKLLLAALLLVAINSTAQIKLNLGRNTPMQKLINAEMAINNLYVDSVDENKLIEEAIRGMLKSLDPHSSYATKEEVKALQEPLNGNFEGIGVEFNLIEDTLLVIQPVVGGPSEKAGILAGDRIVSVDGTPIAGVQMSKEEIMRRLRGPKGTKVKLGIIRQGFNEELSFKVTRDKIPVKSIDATYMIRPQCRLHTHWQLRSHHTRRICDKSGETTETGHAKPGARPSGERWRINGFCRQRG